jgi:uncharacterized protein YacL
MLLYFLRAFLVLALLAVSMIRVEEGDLLADYRPYLIIGAVVLAALVITFDSLVPRKSLQALSGVFFGLVVGLLITYGLSLILDLLVSAFRPDMAAINDQDQPAIAMTKVLMGIVWCYLCVSFILQTKDDVRFVIPYVEFAKQIKGQRPLILDTSVIIDGRIADICETGIIDQALIVPRFVLQELQAVADSSDRLKRNRGRRGLDVLNKLQSSTQVEVKILDAQLTGAEAQEPVDLKLLTLATQLNGRVATNDFNLNKMAKLRGVQVINLNDLTNALKSVVLVGETMTVKIIKAGEEPGQGVGYLDDGTMIVVDQARPRLGEAVDIAVTSVLQTSAGRMIFGRMEGTAQPQRKRTPSEQT